ncbi:MAG: helix-turn-helix domain-containing protein [Bacteroidota bacterium]
MAQKNEMNKDALVILRAGEMQALIYDAIEKALCGPVKDELLTAKEASLMLKQSEHTTRADFRSGRLHGFKIPGKKGVYFNRRDVQKFWMDHYNESLEF